MRVQSVKCVHTHTRTHTHTHALSSCKWATFAVDLAGLVRRRHCRRLQNSKILMSVCRKCVIYMQTDTHTHMQSISFIFGKLLNFFKSPKNERNADELHELFV